MPGRKRARIEGYGAYTVRKNSLMAGDVPNVGNPSSTENGMTISHKEFIGDVITGATANTFVYTSYDLTPTNAQLWEWLSQVSVNFDEWKPEGIIFFFKSTSGKALNSVNTALGQVIMSTNYNPYNSAFSTKAEMESYEFTTSGDPSQDLIHAIECDPSQGSISTYYSNAGPASGFIQDKRFNTLGTFYIATNGFQGTSVNIGELWVTYQFTFLKSKLYSSLGMANDYFFLQTPSNQAVGTSPFGTAGLDTTRNTAFPFSGFTPSATQAWLDPKSSTRVVFHFPVYAFKTTYRVMVNVHQTAAAAQPSFTVTTDQGAYNSLFTPTALGVWSGGATGDVKTDHMWQFDVIVPGGFIGTSTNTPWFDVTLGAQIPNTHQFTWYLSQVSNAYILSTV